MDYKSLNLFNPTQEHSMLREMIRSFVKLEVEPQAQNFDRKEEFNLPLFKKLGEMGLLGITADPKFGGSGMDPVSALIAHEELSYSDPGFCLAYLAHAILCVNNISANGSEEQKEKYLPKLISGEWIGCMAMSEPHVGTDVLGMQTRCELKKDHYNINGRKMWITNGTIDENKTPADVVVLYAKNSSNKPSQRKLSDISTFIISKEHKGYSVGQKIKDKAGMRASNTAELVFDNCQVPLSSLIENKNNNSVHMMKNLELERLTLAAMSLGIAKRCLVIMNQYAQERESFGKPLNSFGQIQKYIAESFAQYQAARTYTYNATNQLNVDKNSRLNSDGAKLFASTAAKNIADNAIQVLGGYGYVGEYVVERLWRDSKLLEIGGGTLEAHQRNITKALQKEIELIF